MSAKSSITSTLKAVAGVGSPERGEPLLFEAVPGLRWDDPRRVLGGGKITSPVVGVRSSSRCNAAAPYAEGDV